MSRVGSSVVASRVLDISRPADEQRRRRLENLVRNAGRIAETLGELKGGAMKIGQMLSLHDGLMPPEAAEVLRGLQQQAPAVPFDAMQARVRSELPEYDTLFESLDPEPWASASIGQVHRGRLRDGRDVAVKIQYPEIDRIVAADLLNMRRVLQRIFALVSDADFEPIWEEVRERLLEELDYGHEAENARRFAAAHADAPEIVVPAVVDAASTRGVLTMVYEPGLDADEACSERHPQELRDRWGQRLFTLLMRGLFDHRLLHADPNFANFAFRTDGTIVVYDLGCLKQVPRHLSHGYGELMRAAMEQRLEEIPRILESIDVRDEAGGPIGRDLTDPYVAIFGEVFRADPPYRFGEYETLYDDMIALGMENWSQQLDVRFPGDLIFLQRTLSGHFGNMTRLNASGPWREIALHWIERSAD